VSERTGVGAQIREVGAVAAESETERDARVRLTFLVLILIPAGVAWGLAYLGLGRALSASIPLAYSAVSGASLVHFAFARNFRVYAIAQFLGLLLLPVLLQWSLGGFVEGSAVMLFAVLSPIGVLTFLGPKPAVGWFVAFGALCVVSGLVDPWLPPPETPFVPWVRSTFFAVNLLMVTAMLFLAFQHFARMQIAAHDALVQTHSKLIEEKANSERLLLNILPAAIATRLKLNQGGIADGFGEVSVLFADIVGFTVLSARLEPKDLVAMLDEMFSRFDQLADRHHLEKIKTIGDAYMVAGGIPEPRSDHLADTVEMALDMRRAVADVAKRLDQPLSLRIGIHIGPVVAGVIGKRKFTYDLWGDAVNTASRMESHGLPSSIHVTDDVRTRLGDRYAFEDRGVIEVKGKGAMRTWLLLDAKQLAEG
jgi:adenylate cyclase